jgi:hypothetical protein
MVNTEVRPKGGGGDLYPASTYLHDAIMAIPREKESTGFFTAMKLPPLTSMASQVETCPAMSM